jgi:hypothetical protein
MIIPFNVWKIHYANKLAMEIAHQFGTYSIWFKSILETNGLKLTPRKIDGCRSFDDRINPITKLFSSGGLSFDAEKAKTYIVHQLNTGVEQNG